MESPLETSHQGLVHVLLVPFPTQGHVAPIMKLGHRLAGCGSVVTLLVTEFIHRQMDLAAMSRSDVKDEEKLVNIVAVPDGLPPEDDRQDRTRLVLSIHEVMPGYLEVLIKKANNGEDGMEKFTCVIADFVFGWALKVAAMMGLKQASFFVSSPGTLATILLIPKLIEAGIIDPDDGTMIKEEKIQPSPNLPALKNDDYLWNYPENRLKQKNVFQYILNCGQNLKASNWVLCNWFHELDPSAVNLLPSIVTVGPLLSNEQSYTANLWSEDSTCLTWLDKRSPGSVIYVAFGSTTKFSRRQFAELALGLELICRPFLWVVRSDISAEYPDGFIDRTSSLGKIVQWAPQETVLAHPSIACFLTHSGWNSTLEGLSMGVPMLCWPYYTDHFYIRSCVCHGWKVGLELNPDDGEIVTRHKLKKKVDELLSDDTIRANAFRWKELAQRNTSSGGSSSKNLQDFIAKITL